MAVEVRAGEQLAGYRIEALVGRGGMSHVYRAVQTSVDRLVALKVLSPEWADNSDFRQRFLAEARVAATIEHPNILPIYDAGEADGRLFIAMRLVDGTDLRRLLDRDERLSLERTVALIEAAAAGLDAAHARGLVHRDIKPANLLLAADHLYLADFGVAKIAAARREFTRTGMFVGTLDYASPEQIRNEELDGRADLYSLGCVLYHCLAGAPPFDRPSEYGTMHAHMYDPPPSLRARRPELPEAIDDVVAAALAKQRDERFRTGRHFVHALRESLKGRQSPSRPESATPTVIAKPPPARTSPSVGRMDEISARKRSSWRLPYGVEAEPAAGDVRAGGTPRNRRRVWLPTIAPLRSADKVLAGIGFGLCTAALFTPVWATRWPAEFKAGTATALPQSPSWLVVAGLGAAVAVGGVLWRRVFAWAGLAILSISALLPNGIGPLLRDVGVVPAPRYSVDLGFWLTAVGLGVALLGLLGSARAWLRIVGVGVGLSALSFAVPTWAMLVPMDISQTLQPVRIFDGQAGVWAGIWVAAFVAVCAGLLLRLPGLVGRRLAVAIAATSITWAGVLTGAVAVIWGLGFSRFPILLATNPRTALLGEGFWVAVLGLTVVSLGLVLEVTTAEEPQAGRWNTVTRIFAPFQPPTS